MEKVLEEWFVEKLPEKLVGNKAHNYAPLDGILQEQDIDMIAPHRGSRKKRMTQDGRKLRRYERRWKVAAAAW